MGCSREVLKGGGGRRRGDLGPKSLCTKNGLTRFSLLKMSFFPTMVTLVWGGGPGGLPTPLLLLCTAILTLPWALFMYGCVRLRLLAMCGCVQLHATAKGDGSQRGFVQIVDG